jgi:hypothetical protein
MLHHASVRGIAGSGNAAFPLVQDPSADLAAAVARRLLPADDLLQQ